ncbi:hypothetical protein [Nonomuraea sp. NPDC049695]|uniref:hypothetical protein n=1 Tax=Nonomuraea sp. NPDC049695 TaxID=3154734 RepID=UPI003416FF77
MAASLLGFSWPALLWGLGLAILDLVIPGLLVLLPWRLTSDLARPDLAGPATTVLNLTAGILIELARMGVVTLQDMQLRDAVWLGLGVQLIGVLLAFVVYGGRAILRPSPLDLEQAAAGRSDPYSYGRSLAWFGGNALAQVGLSLLLALSPWLALVTVPVGAFWNALIHRDPTDRRTRAR